MTDIDALRLEAEKALDAGLFMLRSCWNCNEAHDHLKEATDTHVLECFDCGHFYFRGVDVTIVDHVCESLSFDRTICPEPCGMMHYSCDDCGKVQDCEFDDGNAPAKGAS